MALHLVPHPEHPPRAVRGVAVRWHFAPGGRFLLRFLVDGVDALDLPQFAGRARADDLWRATCFEMFVGRAGGEGYAEFNFSPSGRWAAYRFAAYREGRSDLDLDGAPVVATAGGQFLYTLTATLDVAVLRGARALGISAVIVEKCGATSYWAARHGRGEPDFHDAAGFCVAVPVPSRDRRVRA